MSGKKPPELEQVYAVFKANAPERVWSVTGIVDATGLSRTRALSLLDYLTDIKLIRRTRGGYILVKGSR